MPISVLFWKGRRAMIDTKKSIPAADYLSAGRSLVEEGYYTEGLDFFKKAHQEEDILKLAQKAVEEGDFFLYSLTSLGSEHQINQDELMRLSQNAHERGLFLYERKALELLGKEPKPIKS